MQKYELSTWSLLLASALLGSVTTMIFAGCKPRAIETRRFDSDFSISERDPDSNVTGVDSNVTTSGLGAVETPLANSVTSQVDPPGGVSTKEAVSDSPKPSAEIQSASESSSETSKMKEDPATGGKAAETVAAVAAGTAAVATASSAEEPAVISNKEYVLPEAIIAAGGDWPQWGGNRLRNNTPQVTGLPTKWNIGKFDRKTGAWDNAKAENILWYSNLGSQTYGNPVIANGRVYVGTNNGSGYLKRYPANIDLGCLICLDEKDGSFLWQHSSEKLHTGRVHDWPLMGICCSPLVEGERLWFVTSRGEVRCLDTQGFFDDEDDGPVVNEPAFVAEVISTAAGYNEALVALDNGSFTDVILKALDAAGEALDGTATVKTVTAGKVWTASGKFGGVDRELAIKQIGPRLSLFKAMSTSDKQEADTIWVVNMMTELGVSQHNMCSCSVTCYGDLLFVNTSNGLDESHINLPAPNAPSFICLNKNTGEVLWTDASPGTNIHHGQWSSPAVAELGGVVQVLFAGGDGILYSFKADAGKDGKPELLWQFDCNPKTSKLLLGGEGTRNDLIGTPVVYGGLVYIATGQDPEHGEGEGHMWCIDPTKRGDVSSQLAVKITDDGKREVIPHKRIQAVEEEKGETAIDNPNSAAVWHYSVMDGNKNEEIEFEEEMHRTIGSCAVKDDLVYIADLSGLFHCLSAKGTEDGKPIVHFTYDMLAQSWGTPLIADGHVFIGDEDGDIAVFELGAENKEPIQEISMGTAVYSTPVAANGKLFISSKDKLFAIGLPK